MGYTRDTLISRAGYSGVGDWWDTLTDALGAGVTAYGAQQQAAGAAAATAQQNRDLAAALAARQGMSTETLLLVGGVGLAAFFLLRKRSS